MTILSAKGERKASHYGSATFGCTFNTKFDDYCSQLETKAIFKFIENCGSMKKINQAIKHREITNVKIKPHEMILV